MWRLSCAPSSGTIQLMATKTKTIRLISWNVNGIRAAEKKGFLDWMVGQWWRHCGRARDQGQPEQCRRRCATPNGYQVAWASAEKKGYSGVATYSRSRAESGHRRPGRYDLRQRRPHADQRVRRLRVLQYLLSQRRARAGVGGAQARVLSLLSEVWPRLHASRASPSSSLAM